LSDRDGLAVREEGPDAEVGVHALDARRVDGPGRARGDVTVRDSLRDERFRDAPAERPGRRDRPVPELPQLARDLVREHLAQTDAEEVRSVPAIRARDAVAP